MFIEKLPVPPSNDEFEATMDKPLQSKDYEAIDRLIYEMYSLNEGEIAFIEK